MQRWDGEQWKTVGAGVYGPGNTNATVYDFLEHEGKLYVAGQFLYADGITSSGIAVWDGTRWCGTGIYSLDGGIFRMEVYNDSLFVACNQVLYGDSVFFIAKIAFKDIVDTCGEVVTGIDPHPVNSNNPVQVYPNPVADILFIDIPLIKGQIQILSLTGQELSSIVVHNRISRSEIDVSRLSAGIYLVKISNSEGIHTLKFVKE
ncbi:MAG: T9SS type A sorting domain-containing protein [Bacteroidia bacterium]